MLKRFTNILIAVLLISAAGLLCSCTNQNVSGRQQASSTAGNTAAASSPAVSEGTKKPADEALKKLSTSLLQLADSEYLPAGKTKEQLIAEMKDQGQIKDFNSASGVYVYIQLDKDADIHVLDKLVLETANTDEAAKLTAAYIDISRIKEVAGLKEVKSIKEVLKPELNQRK